MKANCGSFERNKVPRVHSGVQTFLEEKRGGKNEKASQHIGPTTEN